MGQNAWLGCQFVETVGEDAVPAVGGALVDEGGPRTGMTESGQEVLADDTELSGQWGAGMSEDVELHVGQ